MTKLLEIERGCFSYGTGGRVLENICLTAEPGELVAILGPNGSGKTTLLRCMMGFLRWSEGRSLVGGEDIRSIPQRTLRRRLAYVPQSRSATGIYTAEEMILLGRSSRIGLLSQPGERDVAAALAVMERLRITELRCRRCSELSGGELQMVLIARALVAEPEILVLDEPESNLDYRNQLIILNTLASLAADGMACVFNTHYPAHALQYAGGSLLLERGGGYVFGRTRDIVTADNIKRAFGVDTFIGDVDTPAGAVSAVIPLRLSQ